MQQQSLPELILEPKKDLTRHKNDIAIVQVENFHLFGCISFRFALTRFLLWQRDSHKPPTDWVSPEREQLKNSISRHVA